MEIMATIRTANINVKWHGKTWTIKAEFVLYDEGYGAAYGVSMTGYPLDWGVFYGNVFSGTDLESFCKQKLEGMGIELA